MFQALIPKDIMQGITIGIFSAITMEASRFIPGMLRIFFFSLGFLLLFLAFYKLIWEPLRSLVQTILLIVTFGKIQTFTKTNPDPILVKATILYYMVVVVLTLTYDQFVGINFFMNFGDFYYQTTLTALVFPLFILALLIADIADRYEWHQVEKLEDEIFAEVESTEELPRETEAEIITLPVTKVTHPEERSLEERMERISKRF